MVVKRYFIMFWHGLTGIIVSVAEWFTVILGMKDESRFGKFVRRMVGGCFAFMMLVLALTVGGGFLSGVYGWFNRNSYGEDMFYNVQYLSRNATYYQQTGHGDGYVETASGERTITGIDWIVKPLGSDSLACYSDGKRRGYFSMLTGEPVVAPKYEHAWVFSDGLASVDDGGWIKFIDTSGQVVIDLEQPYNPGIEGYVFHNGRCVVYNGSFDRVGLIDKHGKWLLNPDYFSIRQVDSFLVVDNGKEQCVLSYDLRTVVPFTVANFHINDGWISATMPDHTIRRYTMEGEMTEGFYIHNVERLTFDTDEFVTDADGSAKCVQAVAKCRRYEAEYGWYGLMSADGKAITLPSYTDITAVGYDLYLCKDAEDEGILVNGNGEVIR